MARIDLVTIGIAGGMGPLASAELLRRLVRAMPADSDQAHPRYLLDSDPLIPDRTAALMGLGPDPTPSLRRLLRRLEEAGADVILVPCNTVTAFLADAAVGLGTPAVDPVSATIDHLTELSTGVVGLLATPGTIAARVYERWANPAGIQVMHATDMERREAWRLIAAVKAGKHAPPDVSTLGQLVENLFERGADAVVLGCTELSVLADSLTSLQVIDPLDRLVAIAVEHVVNRTAATSHDAEGAQWNA